MSEPELPPEEPLLQVDQIQGNVLPGFMKPTTFLCALTIVDVGAAKLWIREIGSRMTTLAEALESRVKVRALRTYRPAAAETLGAVPEEVDDAWANISFSYSGLTKLLAGGAFEDDQARFEDEAFVLGLATRSSLLGDPTDPGAEGNPANWVVGGPGSEIDVLLCIGADRAEEGARLLGEIRGEPASSGMEVVYEQEGGKLDEIGSEQFGFQDGVSQPGVRGMASEGSFLTPRAIDASETPESWLYGLPGQLLTWPGDYVFGYPSSGPDPLVPGPEAAAGLNAPDWSRNGSYLVFRRFRQDVAGFWSFAAEQAARLSAQSAFAGWDAERLAAHIVGRWKSGAPLERSPDADVLALGTDRLANNDFGYAAPSVSLPLAEGGSTNGYPMAQGDPIGATCPMGAHIRKVNTRTAANDLGGRQASFKRRILRRGLPWGPRLEDPSGPDDPADGQRGLLFLSYQASIVKQFEFLCSDWMGSPTNPRSPSGFDLLVGQNGAPGGERVRSAVVFGADTTAAEISTGGQDFVIPTGGGYYFTPSIAALTEVLAA